MPLILNRRFGVKPEAARQADKRKRKETEMEANTLLKILLLVAIVALSVIVGNELKEIIMPGADNLYEDDDWEDEET